MAGWIRGDISLGAALSVIKQYEPCWMQFDKYTEMDQKLPAFEVWRQADPADLEFVLCAMDLCPKVECYKTYLLERRIADNAKSSIVSLAFTEWERATSAAIGLENDKLRRAAQDCAYEARREVCDAAFQAWDASYKEARNRYDHALHSRATYRVVLRNVKSLML